MPTIPRRIYDSQIALSVYLRPLTGCPSDYAGEFNWKHQSRSKACVLWGPLLSRHTPRVTVLTAAELVYRSTMEVKKKERKRFNSK